jgi:hypothetical protein
MCLGGKEFTTETQRHREEEGGLNTEAAEEDRELEASVKAWGTVGIDSRPSSSASLGVSVSLW